MDETKSLSETLQWPGSPGFPAPAARPVARRTDRPMLHLLLLAVTLVTTTMAGARMAGVELTSLRALLSGLPFSITLLAILLTHESGHYLMCRRHGIVASLPYVLPAPPFFLLGTFGAVIRVRSRFPDRRALFDMGAAGPWAGFVVALVAMVVGLRLSTVGTALPDGPTILLGDSLLTSFLARIVLHAEPDTVMLHPVARRCSPPCCSRCWSGSAPRDRPSGSSGAAWRPRCCSWATRARSTMRCRSDLRVASEPSRA